MPYLKWVARLILLAGYGIIIGVVAGICYTHSKVILAIAGMIISMIAVYLAVTWILSAFLWAHGNWRNE